MKSLKAVFFLIIFLSACSGNKVPAGIFGQKEMVDVLVDLHLADGYASVHYSESDRALVRSKYQALYKRYGTDSASVRKSIAYYTRQPDVLVSLYDQVNARLEKMSTSAAMADAIRTEKEQKRIRDSLYYSDHRRDSLYRGFKGDTMSYGPFFRFIGHASVPVRPDPAQFVPRARKPLNNLKTQ